MTTLFADGGHNTLTGKVAWGRVVNTKSEDQLAEFSELFPDLVIENQKLPVGYQRSMKDSYVVVADFKDVSKQQNNGAELLALLCALRIAMFDDTIILINSDSELLTKWWSVSGPNKITAKKMDQQKLAYIQEVRSLRLRFEKRGGKITKISGDDNLADLGFH